MNLSFKKLCQLSNCANSYANIMYAHCL